MEGWGQASLDRSSLSKVFWITLKCPRYPQNSPLAPTKTGSGLGPQRRTGKGDSKGDAKRGHRYFFYTAV